MTHKWITSFRYSLFFLILSAKSRARQSGKQFCFAELYSKFIMPCSKGGQSKLLLPVLKCLCKLYFQCTDQCFLFPFQDWFRNRRRIFRRGEKQKTTVYQTDPWNLFGRPDTTLTGNSGTPPLAAKSRPYPTSSQLLGLKVEYIFCSAVTSLGGQDQPCFKPAETGGDQSFPFPLFHPDQPIKIIQITPSGPEILRHSRASLKHRYQPY